MKQVRKLKRTVILEALIILGLIVALIVNVMNGKDEVKPLIHEKNGVAMAEEINEIEENPIKEVPGDEDTLEVFGVIDNKEYDEVVLKYTIKKIAPQLEGIEDSILQVYEDTGIKPSFQLAKFCLESGYGTSNLAINKNNIAGWNAYPVNGATSYDNASYFDSFDECVLTVGYSLYEYYIQEGITTVDDISKKYCPVNCESWASNVTQLMDYIDETYDMLESI